MGFDETNGRPPQDGGMLGQWIERAGPQDVKETEAGFEDQVGVRSLLLKGIAGVRKGG